MRLSRLPLFSAFLAVTCVAMFSAPAQANTDPAADSAVPLTVEPLEQQVAALGPIDPRPSNAEIAERLDDLAERSDGRVDVRTIGESNEGQPIWAARVGQGSTRILYVSQQHGNEPLGAPAALELVESIGVGTTPWHRWLRDQVTVDVIVRANSDGHDRDWRYNYAPDADPEFGVPGQGFDINRYHSPDLHPDDNPATEAAHIQRVHHEFQPDIVADYHMQGRYADADGREITTSLYWPTHPDVSTEAVEASQRAVVVQERAISLLVPGSNVSQYPGGDYDGIARNAYGLLGSASILIELSNMGEEHEQAQIIRCFVAMLALVQSAADGSLDRVDPRRAEDIPPRGDPLPGVLQPYALEADDLD